MVPFRLSFFAENVPCNYVCSPGLTRFACYSFKVYHFFVVLIEIDQIASIFSQHNCIEPNYKTVLLDFSRPDWVLNGF